LEPGPERYFYHSFPRRKEKTDEVEKGLKILSMMKKMGLLLTSENVPWPDLSSDSSSSESWTIAQVHCCFTELGPAELLQHAEHFGHFAIEFDIDVLPRLGAMPIFYLPRRPIGGAEALAKEFVACIGDIQKLLKRLLDLEDLVRINSNKDKRVVITENNVTRETRSSVGGAEDLLSSLTKDIQPTARLNAEIRALSGYFYPIDDLEYTSLLGYYRQREWRILGNMGLTRPLKAHERESLLQLDAEFFKKKLKFGTGIHARIDECKVFQELDGKPIIGYARRVIVPAVAVQRAREIVNEHPPVTALESIRRSKKKCAPRSSWRHVL